MPAPSLTKLQPVKIFPFQNTLAYFTPPSATKKKKFCNNDIWREKERFRRLDGREKNILKYFAISLGRALVNGQYCKSIYGRKLQHDKLY
jgi:hypothetical protein